LKKFEIKTYYSILNSAKITL